MSTNSITSFLPFRLVNKSSHRHFFTFIYYFYFLDFLIIFYYYIVMMKKYLLDEIKKSNNCFPHIQRDYLPECPVHQHDYSELVIVDKGEGKHVIENQDYYVKKGDVFVIKGNTTHTYIETNNFYIYNICFKKLALAGIIDCFSIFCTLILSI